MTDAPERPGAVARLFGSLATAFIDLGLPALRDWLRDRLGPSADISQVTTDGAVVHLDGVHVPIGPRGLLRIDRADVLIPSVLGAGLAQLHLHAFTGVLTFGTAGMADSFRAAVSFTSTPEPEDAAWISGELSITGATWSARTGSPVPNPMNGRARLFVSSREWRLEDGSLEGEIVRARFAGSGIFEAGAPSIAPPPAEGGGPALLIPRSLSTAVLSLEQARVGAFLDAAGALVGRTIAVPPFLPLDAQLDGSLSWSTEDGGRLEIEIAAASLRAEASASFAPTGRELAGKLDASILLASVLRDGGAPLAALPRNEDVVRLALAASGEVGRPQVMGTVSAAELGFRFGGPRFVPAVVVRDLTGEVFSKGDRVVLHAVVKARGTPVTLELDAGLGEGRTRLAARGAVRFNGLEVAFLRDVLRTLGSKLELPPDARCAADLILVPGAGGPTVDGEVSVATASSKLVLAVAAGGLQVTGIISAVDALHTGIFSGSVRPADGEASVALDLARGAQGLVARGRLRSDRIGVAVTHRPDVGPYVLERATAQIILDGSAFTYDDLRFAAHGGHFVAHGAIPFRDAQNDVPRLHVEIEHAGAAFAAALAQLVAGEGRAVAVAEDGVRPPEWIWLPREFAARGVVALYAGARRTADLSVETPSGTRLALVLRSQGAALEGSSLRGAVAVGDLVTSGVLGTNAPLAAEGVVTVDFVARGGSAPYALGWAAATRLASSADIGSYVLEDVSSFLRVGREGLAWKDLRGRAYSGHLASSGVAGDGNGLAQLSVASIALHELPPIAGREPARFVRGQLAADAVGRWAPEGARGGGHLVIEGAAFPALGLVRPVLERYGLRPPSEDAVAPVTARVVFTERAVAIRDASLELHGANIRGELEVALDSPSREVLAKAEMTLEEEYLRTSKLLTLPRALTERLVVPLRIDGTLERPHLHADIAGFFGRFLKDNRVRTLVTSAVEEAQILFGKAPSIAPPAARREPAVVPEALDDELRAAVDAFAADWADVAARRA